MNTQQIHKLLVEVFSDFNVHLFDKSAWSKIKIGEDLEVYTYSGLPDKDDSVWYFNIYYAGQSRETMIPNKNTLEFLQVYKDLFLDILKAKEILSSVNDRFKSIGAIENIRDKRIENITIDYDY